MSSAPGVGAPAAGQPPAAPPKKKSKTGCIVAGCGGCLVVALLVCGTGGYLFYLEEGVSYSDPGDVVTEAPYVPGQPFSIPLEWTGTGYAFHRVYIDLGPGAPMESRVTGTILCGRASEVALGVSWGYTTGTVDETYYYPIDTDHAGWVLLVDEYVRSGPEPMNCGGQLEVSPPVPTARIVITRRQRPSDWISGL
jgi:hypothetical protein